MHPAEETPSMGIPVEGNVGVMLEAVEDQPGAQHEGRGRRGKTVGVHSGPD